MPINFNLEDPAKQEKIRRGTHEYVQGGESHGRYVAQSYHHQEYPKVMDKTPCPQLRDFKDKPQAEILLGNARKQWDDLLTGSIVHNKQQEMAWLAEHKDDPILSVQDRQYPKTMDRTPAPVPTDYASLEDFRISKNAWKEQVAASIVHDKAEEELWLREHQSNQAPLHASAKPGKGKLKAKAA